MGDNNQTLMIDTNNNNNNDDHGKSVQVFKRLKPYVLMVGLQFGAAGMYIISMATLTHGMSRYVLIVYRNAIAALFLAPFALIFERYVRTCTISFFFF